MQYHSIICHFYNTNHSTFFNIALIDDCILSFFIEILLLFILASNVFIKTQLMQHMGYFSYIYKYLRCPICEIIPQPFNLTWFPPHLLHIYFNFSTNQAKVVSNLSISLLSNALFLIIRFYSYLPISL